MSAGVYDITIEQKADFSLSLAFVNPTTGLPIDISLYTFKAEIRSCYGGELITTFTVTIVSGIGGTATMTLTELQTALLLGKNYVYDLIVTTGAGLGAITTRYMQGKIIYSPGVTAP
jgi:hypothetical protein